MILYIHRQVYNTTFHYKLTILAKPQEHTALIQGTLTIQNPNQDRPLRRAH